MYKARAEAVSGSKVLAGGKWLQCIGNKPVRVGENIWTDGRCVYGNFQESQQPLVITAPDGGAIPIVINFTDFTSVSIFGEYDCCTWHKNKLRITDKKIDLKKRSTDSLHGLKYALLVNDTRGNVFTYDGRGLDSGEGRNVICRYLLAANMSKSHRFKIFLDEQHSIDNDGERGLEYFGDIKIAKDGEILHSIDLTEIQKNIETELSFIPDIAADSSYFISILYQFGEGVEHGFIENENRWGVFFSYTPRKIIRQELPLPPTMLIIFHEVPDAPELQILYILDAWHAYGTVEQYEQYMSQWDDLMPPDTTIYQEQEATYWNIIYIDPNGTHLLYEKKEHIIKGKNIIDPVAAYPDLNSSKIFLHGGYYYTMFQINVTYAVDYVVGKKFFAPSEKEIFEIQSHVSARHLLTKVAGGYLFFSSSAFWAKTFVGEQYGYAGLYFFDKNGFTLLGNVPHTYANGVLNQRLLPMKKYKNWQKRIQKLTIHEYD